MQNTTASRLEQLQNSGANVQKADLLSVEAGALLILSSESPEVWNQVEDGMGFIMKKITLVSLLLELKYS